jgi:putative protease
MDEIYIGEVTHYYPKIMVAVITLVEQLNVGDSLHFKSPTGRIEWVDFEQQLDSMEIERKKIQSAEPGQEIAIKVEQRVRKRDRVYKKVE